MKIKMFISYVFNQLECDCMLHDNWLWVRFSLSITFIVHKWLHTIHAHKQALLTWEKINAQLFRFLGEKLPIYGMESSLSVQYTHTPHMYNGNIMYEARTCAIQHLCRQTHTQSHLQQKNPNFLVCLFLSLSLLLLLLLLFGALFAFSLNYFKFACSFVMILWRDHRNYEMNAFVQRT